MQEKQNFLSDESGAVTVDWVVLTGALVGLGLAVTAVVTGGASDASSDIDASLRDKGDEGRFGRTDPPHSSCGDLAESVSETWDTPVPITVVNETADARQMDWVNYGGERVTYATIEPGGSVTIQSYASHPWVFADDSGGCRSMVVATAGMDTVVLSD